jgi:hypothetical protein
MAKTHHTLIRPPVDNDQFATLCLARYRARKLAEQALRSAGIRLGYTEKRLHADQFLREYREECLAWAQRAVADIKLNAPRKRR